MIILTTKLLIGRGTNRECYINPVSDNECIKITHSKDNNETLREIKYYSLLKARNISFKHIAEYYSKVGTNMGEGYAFELIRDYNNHISNSLTHYIKKQKNYINTILPTLVKELESYCFENKIIVKDLNTKNILVNKIDKNSHKLVIIDGLSNSKRVEYFSSNQIIFEYIHKKKWNNFKKKIKINFGISL